MYDLKRLSIKSYRTNKKIDQVTKVLNLIRIYNEISNQDNIENFILNYVVISDSLNDIDKLVDRINSSLDGILIQSLMQEYNNESDDEVKFLELSDEHLEKLGVEEIDINENIKTYKSGILGIEI